MYVMLVVKPDTARLPGVALLPLQAPLPVHKVVLVADQVNVDEPLYDTVEGFALNVIAGTGAGVTVTVAD